MTSTLKYDERVWKFQIPIGDGVEVEMPEGAEVLTVRGINGPFSSITMWALVDPSRPIEVRRFTVVGTGHGMDRGDKAYVGTVYYEIPGSPLILHVFEVE